MMRRLLVLAVMTLTTMAAHAQSSGYPAPGRLIDIGGRTLHLHCTGRGSPTVLLEGGGGAFSVDWALVQPAVAESTRVCAYDRAGLGWSDRGPAYEVVEQIVSDLHGLLQASGEQGPYILAAATKSICFSPPEWSMGSPAPCPLCAHITH